jgi:hypothetical protein
VAGRSNGSGIAVFGENTNAAGWAGYFHGEANVTGLFQCGSGNIQGNLETQNIIVHGGVSVDHAITAAGLYSSEGLSMNNLEVDPQLYGAVHSRELHVSANFTPYGLYLDNGGIDVSFGDVVLEDGVVRARLFLLNSDRNAKADFAPVDTGSVLERLASIPVQEWRYKAESAGMRHMGPMAQDFYETFGLGPLSTAIATVDLDGVALAAIQGLNDKVIRENRALRANLAVQEASIEELRKQLLEIRQLVVEGSRGTNSPPLKAEATRGETNKPREHARRGD